jgi:hypothetical protein
MTLRVVDAAGRRHAEGYALTFGAMGSATTNEEPATITINDQLASDAIDSARASACVGGRPAVAAIQHVIGAAVRSEACAATPASWSRMSMSSWLGAEMPAAAA